MTGNEADYLARLQSTIAGLQGLVAQSERELADSQEERADEARSGAMGRDWQRVQRDIDEGRTTLADVFSGRDDSPAARRLRELSRDNIARLAAQMPPDVENELAEADAGWDRIQHAAGPVDEEGDDA